MNCLNRSQISSGLFADMIHLLPWFAHRIRHGVPPIGTGMTFGNRTTRIPGINLSVRREGSCLAALLSEPTKAQSFVNEHSQQPTAKCAFQSKSGRIARGRKPTAFDGVLGLVGAAEDAACYKVQ